MLFSSNSTSEKHRQANLHPPDVVSNSDISDQIIRGITPVLPQDTSNDEADGFSDY